MFLNGWIWTTIYNILSMYIITGTLGTVASMSNKWAPWCRFESQLLWCYHFLCFTIMRISTEWTIWAKSTKSMIIGRFNQVMISSVAQTIHILNWTNHGSGSQLSQSNRPFWSEFNNIGLFFISGTLGIVRLGNRARTRPDFEGKKLFWDRGRG